MVESAQLYYDNLTIQAGPMAVAKWSSDIKAAERNCIYDLEAMDIYAAKLNEHQLAIRPPTNTASSPTLERWMALTLAVEEKQYAISFINFNLIKYN